MTQFQPSNLIIKIDEVKKSANLQGLPTSEGLHVSTFFSAGLAVLFLGGGIIFLLAYLLTYLPFAGINFLIERLLFNTPPLIWLGIFIPKVLLVKKKFYYHARSQWKHFLTLHEEIKHFNSLVETADALYQAQRSGGTTKLESSERVFEALKAVREDLICALKIEKTCRENPKFRAEYFDTTSDHLKFMQLSENAGEYGQLFNEALQISMNVKEEMQIIQRRR